MLLAVLALLLAAPERLPPVEECATDPSFTAFRDELRGVIARKDKPALFDMLAQDILVDFGGGAGGTDFTRTWALDRPETSPIWAELGSALDLGCARAGDAMTSPSLIVQYDMELDPYQTMIALPGTRLRAAPDDGAAEVATLDWHVLSVVEPVDIAPWSSVVLVDGRKGYVRGDEILSPLDYRATFEKREGKWLLTSFVAGD